MANSPGDGAPRARNPSTYWALATGLAVGFILGRELPRGGRSSTTASEEAAPARPTAAAPAGATYKTEAEFPAGWLKATDLTSVAGLSWDGVSDAQKAAAMQALNERNCECGCGMGSVALCAKKDPNCPRSPKIAKQVVDLAKQGKPLGELLAAIDAENGKKAPAAADNGPAPANQRMDIALPAHSPRKGPKSAKVTVVLFSDFQCPFCKRAVPTLKEIEEKYPKDVQVAFVNQPLPFHDKAMGAAAAFLAAHKQGKAWQMHDKMFENNTALERADLERYAKDLGLDVARFKKDMDDPAIAAQIETDKALATKAGASGTPTFFINGRSLVGAQPFSSFKPVIDEELARAK